MKSQAPIATFGLALTGYQYMNPNVRRGEDVTLLHTQGWCVQAYLYREAEVQVKLCVQRQEHVKAEDNLRSNPLHMLCISFLHLRLVVE